MFDDDDGLDLNDDGSNWFGALEAGLMYAGYRHGQDRQTRDLLNGLRGMRDDDEDHEVNVEVHMHGSDEDDPEARPVNALDYTTASMPRFWDDYIGQEPLKEQLRVHIQSAQKRGVALPHVLLSSGMPGIGKTTMARLIARTMGVKIYELVPPFNIYTLVEAAEQLGDREILFIDEIHKLADGGKRGAEILLKVLEDKVAFLPDGEVVRLADITVIGATTDRDMLPETIIDRFKIKPHFQPYSWGELAMIAVDFAYKHGAEDCVDDEMATCLAAASRGTPRIIEEMIIAARDLALDKGRDATPEEVLAFLEVEPDGLTRMHIEYLTSVRRLFGRTDKHGAIEYIVSEADIQQILRETRQGLRRLESFLIEQGLINRTPRGRQLTDLGVARAEEFIGSNEAA